LEKKIIENEIVADTVKEILKDRKLFSSIIIGPDLITEDPNSVQVRVKEMLRQHAIKRQRRFHWDPIDIELTEGEYLDTIVDEMIRITPNDDFNTQEYSDIIELYKKDVKEYGYKIIAKDNDHFLLASYIYNLNKYYQEKGGDVDSDFGYSKYFVKYLETRYLKEQSGGRLIYNLYKYLSNKQQYTSLINNN
jgi:hypothetical protein